MDKTLQTRKRVSWKDLSRLVPPTAEESEAARSLFISYEKNGYLRRGDLSPRLYSKAVIVDFYNRLAMIRSTESPVRRKKKADWMEERDFSRFNHRSLEGIDDYPLFMQLSALPSIRAGALVLSPFTSNRKKELNTVDSHSHMSGDYCDSELLDAGVSPDDQFHLFIDAVHLLGKCVGYTLDYRMDRFAVAVLRRPDLFRWIDLNNDLPYREMLTDSVQKEITSKVSAQVNRFLADLGGSPDDSDYDVLREKVKKAGFWTVPSCRTGSTQLPFLETEQEGAVPRFIGGEENLTSFKFHHSYSSGDSLRPVRNANDEAVNYYSSLYIKWRDSFSFDLIKFGGIDYVDDESKRCADCPDLSMIEKVINRTKSKISHTGIIGSVSGNRELMASIGFNALLKDEQGDSIDRTLLGEIFQLHGERPRLAVALTGILDEYESNRRVFISRFIGTGRCAIPKYEIAPGDSDLYHNIENIYTRYRDIMKKGELAAHFADDRIAWWIIRSGNNLLISLLSLDGPEGANHGPMIIDYSEVNKTSRVLSVVEYDFKSSGGDLFLCGDEKILCDDLPSGGFRLFSVQ